jgi:hypothetical protein
MLRQDGVLSGVRNLIQSSLRVLAAPTTMRDIWLGTRQVMPTQLGVTGTGEITLVVRSPAVGLT